MTKKDSILKDIFPDEVRVDKEGKRNNWEYVVCVPFVDPVKY
jgi:5'-3' exonuclease